MVTQLAFSFTTAPFVLLSLSASFLVWSRVYFYVVIGTALATAFFASPAKGQVLRWLNGGAPKLQRTKSQESLAPKEPVLGLPPDPEKDFEEAVQVVKAEMEARQRTASKRQ